MKLHLRLESSYFITRTDRNSCFFTLEKEIKQSQLNIFDIKFKIKFTIYTFFLKI